MKAPAALPRARAARLRRHVLSQALLNLRAYPVQAMLSALGVFIGIAGLVTFSGVIKGLDGAFAALNRHLAPTNVFIEKDDLETDDFLLVAGRPPMRVAEAENLQAKLGGKARAVVPIFRASSCPGLQLGTRHEAECEVLGTNDGYLTLYSGAIHQGRALTAFDVDEGRPVALIGPALFEDLRAQGLGLGDTVYVGDHPLVAIGVLEPRRTLWGSNEHQVLIPYTYYIQQLPVGPLVVGIIARSVDQVPALQAEAIGTMRAYRHLLPGEHNDFGSYTFADAQGLYRKLTFAAFLAVELLTLLALIISGSGIMNTLLVAAEDRRQEVGVLMALGARPNTVLAIFLVEAVCMALGATVAGVLVGATLTFVIGRVSPLPAHLVLGHVLSAALYGLGVGLIFGLFPAWRASRQPPSITLRADA